MTTAHRDIEYVFSGVVMRSILTGRESDRKFCLFENHSDGNSGTPVHIHAFEDETVHVLEGEMQAVIFGVARTVQAGEAIFMPRGVPHQLKNASGGPSKYLLLCTPSGFEEFVATAGRVKGRGDLALPPTPEEMMRMKEVAPRFGIALLSGFESPQEKTPSTITPL